MKSNSKNRKPIITLGFMILGTLIMLASIAQNTPQDKPEKAKNKQCNNYHKSIQLFSIF